MSGVSAGTESATDACSDTPVARLTFAPAEVRTPTSPGAVRTNSSRGSPPSDMTNVPSGDAVNPGTSAPPNAAVTLGVRNPIASVESALSASAENPIPP